MPANPFSNTVEVQIQGESDSAESAIAGAREGLLSLRNAAGVASAALAGLATAGLAKATSAAADWEQQMAEVQKVTSAATMRQLDESLRDLGNTIPVATSELADVAEVAGRLGVQGADNIERFTETTSKMAVATNLNAQDAANAFARLANALNTPIAEIENMGSAVNSLSNIQQKY